MEISTSWCHTYCFVPVATTMTFLGFVAVFVVAVTMCVVQVAGVAFGDLHVGRIEFAAARTDRDND